ncbi:MAG: hypothetical protein KVP17_003501 [Porospora cf. gigantea B]|nr:MAG: hypothetical protein KVP17_003501 [Porospora cf. gigantea B]
MPRYFDQQIAGLPTEDATPFPRIPRQDGTVSPNEPNLKITSPAVPHLRTLEPATPMLPLVEVPEHNLQMTSPAVPHLNAVAWLEPATPMLPLVEVSEPNLQMTSPAVPHPNAVAWLEPATPMMTSPAVPHLNAVSWLEPATPIITPVELDPKPYLQTLPTPAVEQLQIIESETPVPCCSNVPSRRKRSYSEMISDALLPDRDVPKTRMRFSELLPYEEVVALREILEATDSEDPGDRWAPVVAQQPAMGVSLSLNHFVAATQIQTPVSNLQITSPADTSNLRFLNDDVEVWNPPPGPRLDTQFFETNWGLSVEGAPLLNGNYQQWRDASTKVYFEDDDTYNEKQTRMTPLIMDRPVSQGLFDITQRSPIRTESVPLIDDAFFCWSNRCPPEAGIFWSALRGPGYKGEPLINSHEEDDGWTEEDDGWTARMKPVLEAQEERHRFGTEMLGTELAIEDIQRTFEANLNLARQRPRTL